MAQRTESIKKKGTGLASRILEKHNLKCSFKKQFGMKTLCCLNLSKIFGEHNGNLCLSKSSILCLHTDETISFFVRKVKLKFSILVRFDAFERTRTHSGSFTIYVEQMCSAKHQYRISNIPFKKDLLRTKKKKLLLNN